MVWHEHESHQQIETPPKTSHERPRIITAETPLGGAIYPFLAATNREWSLFAHPLGRTIRYPQAETFAMLKPTLRWVNGSDIMDVFVEGQTTAQFLAASGLSLSLEHGGYVLSKRLSRLMRPHFLSGFFPRSQVAIGYRDDFDAAKRKIWDGAGLISRRFLERLSLSPDVLPIKRAYLTRQLRSCQRVEFTLMTEQGQDKGHAIVSDSLREDFVLPRDTKPEVRLVNGECFVGVDVVHAHETMRLDIQSLINLHPFFQEKHLTQWLDDEGALFGEAVESGEVGAAMGRLDSATSLSDIERWPLREYLASGGHPLWFADMTRNLMNQHLDRLNHSTLEKLHLPIPGGRFYIMPIGVGQAAGIDQIVPRGSVRLERDSATAWVNDEDWLDLEGSSTGIAQLLGGADNDDALWVHGFTDYDGEANVLCWRSPNQAGEYVLLRPTLGSAAMEWTTPEGTSTYPPGDSRLLPPRKDHLSLNYQQVVDPNTSGGLGKGHEYSIQAMSATIQRALANAGTLGMYCNMLMVSQALRGELPSSLPAELETVIDGSVKTGVDLSAVRNWCYSESARLLDSHTPIPAILLPRVLAAKDDPQVTLTQDHWLDSLVGRIQEHITTFVQIRDSLMRQAMPPAVIFDHAFEEHEYLDRGAGLHHAYRNALRLHQRQRGKLIAGDYEAARHEAEAYVSQFPEETHTSILRSAIVSGYLREEPTDSVLWLPGEPTPQGRTLGMAHLTIQALREIGVLAELGETSLGLLAYPRAVIQEPLAQRSIGINGVWFNWWQAEQRSQGHMLAATPGDVPRNMANFAKQHVADLTHTEYRDLALTIQTQGDRKVALTADGQLFGFISRESHDLLPEGQIVITFSLCHDGNLRCLWQPFDPHP